MGCETTSRTVYDVNYRGRNLFGIELLAKSKRREGLLAAAEAMFAQDLGGRIFGFESDAARSFSTIAAHRRALGRPISHADGRIAAIAQVRGAKLANCNVADFEDCGLDVLDLRSGSGAFVLEEAKTFRMRRQTPSRFRHPLVCGRASVFSTYFPGPG
jgi:hypothetical protein